MNFTQRLVGMWLVSVLTGCHAETTAQAPLPKAVTPYSLSPAVETVIGDLGGAPVAIPREYVRLVEYEGDPHWLGKRTGPPLKRTYESKLTSFAILVHLPTMKPLTQNNWGAYQKRGFLDMEWTESGVAAGTSLYFKESRFPKPYEHQLPGQESYKTHDYERLPDEHGLKAWRATRLLRDGTVLDDKSRKHSMQNHHLYFAYEGDKIVAYIKCGSGLTSEPGGRKTCQHHFVLWPEMKAEMRVRYGPEMLEHWRTHQKKMRDLMLSFRIKSVEAPPSALTTLSR